MSQIAPAGLTTEQYQEFTALQKTGTSTWTLTGTQTATAPLTVNGGTLFVDGSIATSPLTTVNNGSTLMGTGTMGATRINFGGTFAPGSGTAGMSMTVAGNLAFQSGAFYLVQVNSSTASFANVSSAASLAGTVQANVSFASTKTYDILHSGPTGLGGTMFDALVVSNPNFKGILSYSATDGGILAAQAKQVAHQGFERLGQDVGVVVAGASNHRHVEHLGADDLGAEGRIMWDVARVGSR